MESSQPVQLPVPTPSRRLRIAEPKTGPIVSVEALTKVYPSRRRGDVVAVDGVSFEVSPGEIVGLLGPNGAGKTTTIKCLCTLIRPTSGSVTIAGEDAVRRPRQAVGKVAAVLEGNRNIYWRMTVKENLEFFAALNGISPRRSRAQMDALLQRFDLTAKGNTPARMLSRGMQQKLAVACAFMKETPILLLDEPTLGLDVETSHELRRHLREMATSGERTILLSSHDMSVVQDTCDRVIIINEGKIITDDRVDNLLELFRVRAFRFEIEGVLDSNRRGAILARFPSTEIEADSGLTTMRVELPDGAALYELIDLLRGNGLSISSIHREDPDLEEVFLRIVSGRGVR